MAASPAAKWRGGDNYRKTGENIIGIGISSAKAMAKNIGVGESSWPASAKSGSWHHQ